MTQRGASPRRQMLIVPEGAHFSETDIALTFQKQTLHYLTFHFIEKRTGLFRKMICISLFINRARTVLFKNKVFTFGEERSTIPSC